LAEYRFIVTGPKEQVDSAVEEAAKTMGIEISPTHSLDLWFLEGLDDCPGLPTFQGAEKPVMVYYTISRSRFGPSQPPSPEQVVAEINKGGTVFADLVWGITNIGDRPWHPGESPYKDFYIPFQGELADGQEVFNGQWALASDEGIRLGNGEDPSGHRFTGKGVRIGVFDTRPNLPPSYIPEAPPIMIAEMGPPHGWTFSDITEWRVPPFRDHGLFVSGLINAVAPDGTIVLYPVLDGNGLGDLYTLDRALHSFIVDWLMEGETLTGAVINLSLGSPMNVPSGSPLDAPFGQEVSLFRLLEDATSLRTLLSAAVCHNIVVVAAAGNQAGMSDMPAAYPWVIGVMASTVEGKQACYSNSSQLAAPGGGVPEGITPDSDYCVSKMEGLYKDCADAGADEQSKTCKRFVMSWVTDPGESSPTGYAYAYGTGTSFSAPLVSGLAALLQEAGTQVVDGQVPPEMIKESIVSTTHHTTFHYGVIDVQGAVEAMLNPQ
jgi:subtilisin family serine protease